MSAPDLPAGEPAFWPSQYTAALLHVLRLHAEWVRGARVLEIGCGSGVLLAAAGALGAAALCGVDVEPAAVAATRRLLLGLDLDAEVEVYRGDLFTPVNGRRFDLIVANLPHFPMEAAAIGDRLPTWSSGGADGRSLLDPFVAGLGGHLAPSGRAVIAHNAFVDLDATRAAALRQGLRVDVTAAMLVDLAPPKLSADDPRGAPARGGPLDPPLWRSGFRRDARVDHQPRPRRRRATVTGVALFLGTWLALVLGAGLAHAVPPSPDEALARLLREARASLPEACADPAADGLIRILCAGEIRVGVRANYPLFATSEGAERSGYDIDVARAIASRLGVRPEWVSVRAATRIAALAEGDVDLVVATMGHNTQRDAQARFIRPHYYRSETIVVGPRETPVDDWRDLPGRSICVTVGNYANAQLVSQGARLMLFDDASRLPRGLARRDLPPRRAGRQLLRVLPRRSRVRIALRAEVRFRPGSMGHGGAQSGQRAPRRGSAARQPDHAPGRRVPGTRPTERDLHGLSRGAARLVAGAGLCRPGGDQRPRLRAAGARGRTAAHDLRPGGGSGARLARRPSRHRPVTADADERAGLAGCSGWAW